MTEVIATSTCKASAEFAKLSPSLVVIFGYGASIYFMMLVIRILLIGITYTVWSGLGIILVALMGALIYKQIPNADEIFGMGLHPRS